MSETHRQQTGLTRRELLKRGAVLGGALAWSTPAVQLVGMQRALASHVSKRCICVKYDGCAETGVAGWVELGNPNNPGNCSGSLGIYPTDCETDFQPDSTFVVGNCSGAGSDEFCIEFNGLSATITFPQYCFLVSVAEKTGVGDGANCFDRSPGTPNNSGSYTFTIESDCSHLEFCFDC